MKDLIKKLIPEITPEMLENGRKRRKVWWNNTDDLTCLSYWFPKIEAAGLPVPETILVPMEIEVQNDIFNLFDGNPITGVAEPFFESIRNAADKIGYPCFLRTGQTSDKHNWGRSCYLPSRDQVESHVIQIVEFSAMADFIGLRCNIWAVRELLPTIPLGVCPGYGDMPVCREFRVFVEDGEVQCWHAYWPKDALKQGRVIWNPRCHYQKLCRLDGTAAVLDIASKAGKAVGGAWSVDVLETEKGWYLTDMAEAHKSWHWPGCENAKEKSDG